ncbi:hypothetical protein GCM10010300_23310 [Streptomyces olivaceoviridis]|nr:hypothetical protein GCM10010300_23310 [Streptomyces olivaceoviridis]
MMVTPRPFRQAGVRGSPRLAVAGRDVWRQQRSHALLQVVRDKDSTHPHCLPTTIAGVKIAGVRSGLT